MCFVYYDKLDYEYSKHSLNASDSVAVAALLLTKAGRKHDLLVPTVIKESCAAVNWWSSALKVCNGFT